MPKFISDEEMASLEKSEPQKKKKRFLSDEDMAAFARTEAAGEPSDIGFFQALGIPGRAVAASIRSAQEAVGGDVKKPWGDVLEGNRDIPLDILRAITSPSGKPKEDQSDAHISEKIGSFMLGTATDPLTYVPLEKVASGLKFGSKAVRGAELGAAKLAGSVAEPLTVGRITKEGMEHAVKDFSPMEQIFAKKTLSNARESYGPLKDAADRALVGRKAVEELPFNISQVDIPKGIDEAVDHLGVAYDKLKRQLSGSSKVGSVPKDVDVGSPVLQSIVSKIDEIKGAGKIDALQATELQDMLSQLQITPLGNPRSVPGDFKSAYGHLQSELADIIRTSAPKLGEGRDLFHGAASMNVGRYGGKMTEMIRQADINQAILEATNALQSSDAGALSRAFTTVAVKSGPAWNAFVGTLRIPPEILAGGMDMTAEYIVKNPTAGRALMTSLHGLVNDHSITDAMPPMGANQPPIDPGNSTPPMQPPMPPPIDPKDQALMDLTGLASVNGGKIQDPMERKRFVDDVEQNHNLTPRERMIIQAKALRDGTIVLPQDLRQ